MNTFFLLMAEYESPTIPLAKVAERYLGMSMRLAEQRAIAGKLPIPTFRVGDSQKAPRMVHVQDLAEHIDKRRALAKEEMAQVNSSKGHQ